MLLKYKVSRHQTVLTALLFGIVLLMTGCGSKKNTVSADRQYNKSSEVSPKPLTGSTGSDKKVQEVSPTISKEIKKLIAEAREWLGTPYRYGGKDKGGTDCSGFVMQVFVKALDISLPRSSREQHEYCHRIDKKDLVPGDLVFFSSKAGSGKTSHVGLYIGDGVMIHASTSSGVIESSIESNYYVTHYNGSGRVPALNGLLADAKTSGNDEQYTLVQDMEDKKVESQITEAKAPIKDTKTPIADVKPQPVEEPVTPPKKDTPNPAAIVKNAFNQH